LQFPFASVIEAIIRNPDKYNDILVCNTPLSSTSMPAQQLTLSLHIESYKDMILDEDNRLYDLLVKHFTNTIMDNAVGASSNSSLSSTFPLSNQCDMDRKEEESESFHQSKGDISD
jgi:hypothetical protein